MNQIKGVVPVLITPIDQQGEVDVEGLIKLIKYLCDYPIGGLWVLGTGGEDMSLSYGQRIQVAKVVAESTPKDVPVIMGCGFFSMRESLDFIDETSHLSFYAYHALPYHPLLSLDRIGWWYEKLADHSSKPIWMYTSANWARFIPPEFVKKMKQHKNIVGVKYSSSNAVHMERVSDLADDNFQVISAVVRTFYSNLCLGIKATTSVEACPFIKPICDIYDKYSAGDHVGALKLQRSFNDLLDLMPADPSKDNFIRVAEGKYILSKIGVCKEYMSGYYRNLTSPEKSAIDALLRDTPILQ